MGQDEVLHTIMITFHYFVSELLNFDCFCLLILCNFHFCIPHNSVIVWDIFMKLHRNVYQVKMMGRLQE